MLGPCWNWTVFLVMISIYSLIIAIIAQYRPRIQWIKAIIIENK